MLTVDGSSNFYPGPPGAPKSAQAHSEDYKSWPRPRPAFGSAEYGPRPLSAPSWARYTQRLGPDGCGVCVLANA
eukprot:4723432-Alexandrium_andersonii.AAC.1